MSKKQYYLDTENLAIDFDEEIIKNPNAIAQSPITDLIRFSSGLFWHVKNGNISEFKNTDKLLDIEQESVSNKTETIVLKADKQKFSKRLVNSQGLIQNIFDYKLWERFINDSLEPSLNVNYLDHTLLFDKPIILEEVKEEDQVTSNVFNREFVYNSYIPEYEQALLDQTIPEHVFPRIYDHLLNQKADIDTPNENLRISLGGLVPEYLSQGIAYRYTANDLSQKYFREFGKALNNSDSNIVVNTINNQKEYYEYYTDVLLSLVSGEYFNNTVFPMYLKMFWNSQIDLSLIDELETKNLTDLIIKYILDSTTQTPFNTPATRNFYEYDIKTKSVETVNPNIFDFKKMLETFLLNRSNGDDPVGFDVNTNANLIRFVDFIKENISVNKRKYTDLNSSCKSHIMFYKVIKKSFSNKSSPVDQFIIKTNKKGLIRFIDTQIRYDRNYFYEVEAATLIVGNKYKYTDDYYQDNAKKQSDLFNGVYRLNVTNNTSMQVLFIPIVKFNGSIVQNPLTKPNIEIASKNKKIIISQNNIENSLQEKYEIIEEEDFAKFKKVSLSQENIDNTILFNNLSIGRKLQVYRTIERPKFYSDFSGKLYKTINVVNVYDSYEDIIIPNVPYYYTFRYLNDHSIPSNPTKVYKVTLKDEDGLVYLDSEIISLEKELLVANSKEFKRYLYLTPSMNQKIVNNDIDSLTETLRNSNDSTSIDLGTEKMSVWNKDFMMILTSKDSGKKIKFRFKFKINKQKE